MEKKIRRMVYILGVLSCLVLLSLLYGYVRYVLISWLERIKVHHWERLPDLGKEPHIIVVTHDTYMEPLLTYALFLHIILKGIWKALRTRNFGEIERRIPISLVASNYIKILIFLPILWPLFTIFISVDRSKEKKSVFKRGISALRVIKCVNKGRSPLAAPQGTRTYKHPDKIVSEKGNKIGRFQPGVGFTAAKTGIPILPIGYKGTIEVLPNSRWAFLLLFFTPILMHWRGPIEVNIGNPRRISIDTSFEKHAAREAADQEIMDALLATVDEIT